MNKLSLIIFLFLSFSTVAQVDVSAELDSYDMLIGDQRPLRVMVHLSQGAAVQKTDLSVLTKDKDFELVSEGKWDTLQTGANTILQKKIMFQYFNVGEFSIPSIPVTYKLNGRNAVARSQPVPITIAPPTTTAGSPAMPGVPAGGEVSIMPIKDIMEEPFAFEDALPWIIAGAFLLLLGGGAFWYYKRKKEESMPAPIPVPVPAHETALQKLDKLRAAKLWQQGDVKAYQSQLTYIVREYLENRYEIQALESTTDQILRDLKHLKFSTDFKNKLREMLQLADMVKFAKAKPPAEMHERLMKDAEQFVLATKKRVAIQETENS